MTPRSVLVTGGAAGIGLAIGSSLAALGHRVLLADISDSVHAAAVRLGASVQGHVADMGDEAQVLGTAKSMTELFGGCDVLVNCAGVSRKRDGQPVPPVEVQTEDWERVLRINLTAPFLLSRELLPGMRQRRFGRIINIASRAGRTFVAPAGVDYAASKAGLIGLTRHLAGSHAADGITVNCIAPGRIETALSSLSSPEVIAAAVKAIPVGRLGSTDEVAAAAVFLASEQASYITGVCLDVNGGVFMA
ncbi:SDR family NAD(P)-dependent oxidoreductase [Xenophilus arseniciresistens]|uniref:SDR family NAD(P)-dependent oxidoreductase n=1 Tax=Xenophilus arseniciresistens TaxID=1283306 RepID=A0AAE3T2F2_9BURK|nr:SDR family NAD(P)-dependent oxidoreductase [Xenophilus arseniciresistens]MDA7419001.1 SDR family NAD(P)-dependent oxidoreductase [Xenophilus arseniciresistens]